MTQWCARIRTLTPAVVALFVASTAAPRAALVYHVHAGGEHFHVHAEDIEVAPHAHHDHDAGEPHHHHHHAHLDRTQLPRCTANGPVIEAADDDGVGHWHSQDLFQPTVAPAVIAVPCVAVIAIAALSPAHPGVDRPGLPVRVRGPPQAA